MPNSTSDSPLEDRVVAELLSLQSGPLAELFTIRGARPPSVIWSPCADALQHPLFRRFAGIAADMKRSDGLLDEGLVDLTRFGELTDWIAEVRIDPVTTELGYRHYGEGIATYRGRNLTGAKMDFDTHIKTFFTAVYRAAIVSRRPVYTEHQPPPDVFIHHWSRFIYPVAATGKPCAPITGFLSMIYPENALAPGLEIINDPILVVDEDHLVLYANRAAREMFNDGRIGLWKRSLFDYAGLVVVMPHSPRELAETGSSVNVSVRQIQNTILSHLTARVSGLIQNGHYYYSLQIEPAG